MVDISSITGTVQSGQAKTNASSQTLSADMNTFLTLLTTQLKYQDPLDPMDTAEFTNQLVQYSSVEQAIQTNTKLDNLLSLTISNLGAQAVSYIGKTAQVLGDVMPLEGGKAKAAYTLSKDVSSVTITVKDMNGKVVYSETGETTSGTHEFTWDGKDSATVTTTIFGKVTGVASDSNGIYIGLGNAVTANLGDILTMRNDDYFDKVDTGNGDNNDGEGGEVEGGDGDGETATPPAEEGDNNNNETASA